MSGAAGAPAEVRVLGATVRAYRAGGARVIPWERTYQFAPLVAIERNS